MLYNRNLQRISIFKYLCNFSNFQVDLSVRQSLPLPAQLSVTTRLTVRDVSNRSTASSLQWANQSTKIISYPAGRMSDWDRTQDIRHPAYKVSLIQSYHAGSYSENRMLIKMSNYTWTCRLRNLSGRTKPCKTHNVCNHRSPLPTPPLTPCDARSHPPSRIANTTIDTIQRPEYHIA